jgi:intracellular sulfur oxidation DsrE/DsrF family protein
MKNKTFLFSLLAALFMSISVTFGQEKIHKVVFHLSTADTLAYDALGIQLNNVLNHWPTAQIEVVVHNNGIAFMQKSKSKHEETIQALAKKGVVFAVCENTIKRKKIDKQDIITPSKFVPVGLAEIIEKQEEGWAYIKSGF